MSKNLALLLATLALLVTSTAAAPDERSNVLFIIADDLSAGALGCYGNEWCRTPNIDALARDGVRFTRAYCQFPVCGPSRAALMSGLYPQAIGVQGNGQSNRFTKNLGERPSMSEVFLKNGYFTARVSKIYHMRVPGDITAGVDGPDHLTSWQERYNCKAPEWMTPGEHEHLTNETLKREPDKHYNLGFGTAFYVVRGNGDGTEQADSQAAATTIGLLEKHRDGPFFLAVGFVRPHVPLVAPESHFEAYDRDEITLPLRVTDDWADIPDPGISKNSRSSGLAGQVDRQKGVLEGYYASVSFMDAQVGRVLDTLDRLGLREETVVVFTSDHGYHLGEHDFWQKMSLHEESVRIPLIVSAPGKTPSISDSLAEQIDIYPTLAELCELDIPSHCQGRSLVRVLDDPTRDVREVAYCNKGKHHLLRTKRWALLSYANGSAELYDMEMDSDQFTNLALDPAHAEVLAEIKDLLARKLTEIGDG